jgi:ABC-2 type transport system permease protein
MINKIKNLTNIFLKDYYQNLNIFNKKNNKINKKSIYFWLIIILISCITYLSLQSITYLEKLGQPILFLKIYLPIVATIIIFQLILLISGIFYYSKDIKDIVHLPVKPLEIIIAKLNTTIVVTYFMEALILIIPLIMYELLIEKTIIFLVAMIITLIIFPILFALIISTIIMLSMKLLKVIKNTNVLQMLTIFILTFLMSIVVSKNIVQIIPTDISEDPNIQIQITNTKFDDINKSFIIINPIIEMLTNKDIFKIIINLMKILIVNILAILIFVFIGTKMYFKDILGIINDITINNNPKEIYKYKLNNKIKTYLKNDIKKIIKNPSFFMQYFFQYIFTAIIFLVILNYFLPIITNQIINDNIIQEIGVEQFKLQATLIVVAVIQIIFSFSNLSITAISREGKNAVFMKYIPISLYTQLKIKTLPQIIINTIISIIALLIISFNIEKISIWYYVIAFITIMFINIINSYLLVLIDLKRPNLNWTNQDSVTRNTGGKIYKYVITIFVFLILSYFSKIFDKIDYINSIIIINIILILIYVFLKKYIKKNIIKIYKKIY